MYSFFYSMQQALNTTPTSSIQSLLTSQQDQETIERHIDILTHLYEHDQIHYGRLKHMTKIGKQDLGDVIQEIKNQIEIIEVSWINQNLRNGTLLLNSPISIELLKNDSNFATYIYYLLNFYLWLTDSLSDSSLEIKKQQIRRHQKTLEEYLTALKKKSAIAEVLR